MIVSVAINIDYDYGELQDTGANTSIGGSTGGGVRGSLV